MNIIGKTKSLLLNFRVSTLANSNMYNGMCMSLVTYWIIYFLTWGEKKSKNQFWLKLVILPQICHWKHKWGEAGGATLTQPIAQFLLYPKDTGGNFDPLDFFFFFFNCLLCIGVWPNNRVVIVSGGQQRDPAIHMHVSILPQTPLPSRLPHSIEQSSLCYTKPFRWTGHTAVFKMDIHLTSDVWLRKRLLWKDRFLETDFFFILVIKEGLISSGS